MNLPHQANFTHMMNLFAIGLAVPRLKLLKIQTLCLIILYATGNVSMKVVHQHKPLMIKRAHVIVQM
jgi:hypothetical protein